MKFIYLVVVIFLLTSANSVLSQTACPSGVAPGSPQCGPDSGTSRGDLPIPPLDPLESGLRRGEQLLHLSRLVRPVHQPISFRKKMLEIPLSTNVRWVVPRIVKSIWSTEISVLHLRLLILILSSKQLKVKKWQSNWRRGTAKKVELAPVKLCIPIVPSRYLRNIDLNWREFL